LKAVTNTGYAIRCNYDIGSSLKFNNKLFDLIQFHFHTPAEHLLGSVTYPLEMHIVHTLRNNPNPEEEYVVIGIFFKEGKENPILKKILQLRSLRITIPTRQKQKQKEKEQE